ncbi:GNAT family N-acetyltransferase [Caulobacter sp. KR2-114]|uniref:GNAT family N-acetyltransferase n=1 Tax=Caulobacter sp. KR2-114 TaxID=3400912 RepID=UPI003C0AAB02
MPLLSTDRLILSPWAERHRAPFAALHADPEVMADLGGPIDGAAAGAKLDRYAAGMRDHGVSRWAIEDRQGGFLGYAGVMWRDDATHPLGPHFEIGWRLARPAWGRGYASEAARAALDHALALPQVRIVFSYTAPDNGRSQAVMARLPLVRAPELDFVADYPDAASWQGLVWRTAGARGVQDGIGRVSLP